MSTHVARRSIRLETEDPSFLPSLSLSLGVRRRERQSSNLLIHHRICFNFTWPLGRQDVPRRENLCESRPTLHTFAPFSHIYLYMRVCAKVSRERTLRMIIK